MTQSSQANLNELGVSTPVPNDIKEHLDKQANGFAIEELVNKNDLSYLEATARWLDENSIPEGNHARYVPTVIIDKIRDEAINDKLLRPSMSKTHKTNSLDFLL